ncbi:PRKR-interacting protein 1 homolog [Anopheles ziemanni]|uniref:PRKR-interacting protein 1 homolog n=1 Tax=Anopheles coustani TaxID=139045 RepID=UPI00265A11C5|nr:PRKR-interacting protein 1 homolog [Anopheles coustani]XP_058170779.1 PRKR-interacting protein 1 homolog [Anopheles ziemanni]
MEIRNEVKPSGKEVEKKKFVVRNAADVQRAKLEKLMKNPDKPVIIPGPAKNRDFSNAIPSFVRNVMGSSAGAGSGEFHVYRHLRRKEYARQKQIQEKSRAEQLDDAFQEKLEQNKQLAEERTAKKRAKRLKKKAKQKANGNKKPKLTQSEEPSSSSESEDAADGTNDDNEGGDAESRQESVEQVKETKQNSGDDEPSHQDAETPSKTPEVCKKDDANQSPNRN